MRLAHRKSEGGPAASSDGTWQAASEARPRSGGALEHDAPVTLTCAKHSPVTGKAVCYVVSKREGRLPVSVTRG